MTFVEVVAKKKSALQNAFENNIFGASILFFCHIFHDETLQSIKTFVNVC